MAKARRVGMPIRHADDGRRRYDDPDRAGRAHRLDLGGSVAEPVQHTLARRHTDFRSEEPPADLEVTGGLALDGAASFRLGGPVGLGVHTDANVNPEEVVLTAGVSLDFTFGS
jgi:hypothetical protein